MGHTLHYQFIDPRIGEYGVAFTAPTEAELQVKADIQGYTGRFTPVVIAYPPRPYGRSEDSVDLDDDGEIPF